MKRLVLFFVLLVASSIGNAFALIGPLSGKGVIKMSKFPNVRINNDKIISKPLGMMKVRGGSLSDVLQSTSSLSVLRDSVANFLSSYLLTPWLSTPPVTKLFVGLSLLATTLSAWLNDNEWPEEFHFDAEKTFGEFQLWRPLTSFLHLGPLGFNYLLTLQFVWTYMSQLEKLMIKTPAEYLVMLIFGATSLLSSYMVFDLPTKFLGHNLSAYLVYIWSKIFEGKLLCSVCGYM